MGLPIAALTGDMDIHLDKPTGSAESLLPRQPFPAPSQEYHYPSQIAAKLAIADEIAMPLAKLDSQDRVFIDQLLAETLLRQVVLARVREYFRHKKNQGDHHAG